MNQRDRKLQSLLELGQIIGLDLDLKEMLTQIAKKACEVMEADRCSVFLYDPETDQLWSTVALGMGAEVIRIPSKAGIAGHCYQKGETLNIEDAYNDPRFNKEVDAKSGYRTRSVLCMPLYKRGGERLGVIELLNKEDGKFNEEDEAFLETFGNHASVFLEIAQLHRARMDAIESSKKQLERLNQAKSRALDHLSHELRTPLAVIQGNIRIIRRKTQSQKSPVVKGEVFDSLEKNLTRLSDIQQETDQIIRSYEELETTSRLQKLDTRQTISMEFISLYPFIEKILEKVRQESAHRDLHIQFEGVNDLGLNMDSGILEDILVGLLKNAIENSPDGGTIQIVLEKKGQWLQVKVRDFGIGITNESQRHLFNGLFHTLETELYTSKKPYDFGAGGKGLDLLRMRAYAQRFGFDISVASQRCIYIPTDHDLCPGKISDCTHCQTPEDCFNSGGSTFCVSFSVTGG